MKWSVYALISSEDSYTANQKGQILPLKAGQLRPEEYPQIWYQVHVRRQNKRPRAARHYWNRWTCLTRHRHSHNHRGTSVTALHGEVGHRIIISPTIAFCHKQMSVQSSQCDLKGKKKRQKEKVGNLHLLSILPITSEDGHMEDHKETQTIINISAFLIPQKDEGAHQHNTKLIQAARDI